MGDQAEWATGACVTVTGLNSIDRQEVQKLIESSGGIYSPSLSILTTHLVVEDGASCHPGATLSDKLDVALANLRKGSWNLYIVTQGWVVDSSQKGKRLDERKYAAFPEQSLRPLQTNNTRAEALAVPSPQPKLIPEDQTPLSFERPAFTQAGFLPLHDLLGELAETPTLLPSRARVPVAAGERSPASRGSFACETVCRTVLQQPPSEETSPEEASFKDLVAQLKALPRVDACVPFREFENVAAADEHSTTAEKVQTRRSSSTEDKQQNTDFETPGMLQQTPLTQEMTPSPDIDSPEKPEVVDLVETEGFKTDLESKGGAGVGGSSFFSGMVVVIDDGVPIGEETTLREALESHGACVCASGTVGKGGVTHAVCVPASAAKWLTMGASVVSNQWVLQSAKLGQRQRCLEISADAARALSSTLPVVGAEESQGATHVPAGPSTSMDERQILFNKLVQSSKEDLNPQISVPASLLNDIAWAVTDKPCAARKEGQREAVQHATPHWKDNGIISDSEEEEEQEICGSCTQEAIGEVLRGIVSPQLSEGSDGGATGSTDTALLEVVLRCGAVSLLLPSDAKGELAPSYRKYDLSERHATSLELLEFIYKYYREEISADEQLSMMQSAPKAAVAEVLGKAFVEGSPLRRWELLGPRKGLEGLVKASREPGCAVYELRLTA